MKKLAAAFALAVPAIALTASVERSGSAAEEEAIRETVEAYFDGMMQAKSDYLRRAFHSEARLIGIGRDGNAMIIPFDRWAQSWDGREPRDVSKYTNTIISTDIAGTAASVKTDLEWPDVHYVDYLSLLKIGGEWKIVNKIWWEESR